MKQVRNINGIARLLGTPMFQQKVVPNKKREEQRKSCRGRTLVTGVFC